MARNTRKTPGSWGTVEQLPSGRWRAFYRVDGVRFSAPRTFESKDAGNAWLAMERADRVRGTWRDPRLGQVTLADYADTWLDSRPDLAPRTRDLYRRTLDRWVLPRVGTGRGIALGSLEVANITPTVVRTWYAAVFTSARERASALLTRNAYRAVHPARAWARVRGMEVADAGQLSPKVLAAWRAAGEPAAHVPTIPAGPDAGRCTSAQAYKVLRAMLTTATQEGLLVANPCQIAGAGVVHHRERSTANPAEVAQLSALMPRNLAAAVTLAAWSGLRYGELFALAVRHVNLEAGTVRVERALVTLPGQPVTYGKPKTTKSVRTVHLPGFVVDELRAHLAEHTDGAADSLVFAMPDGSPVTNLRLSFLFRRARATIGRDDLTWHDLRHTGAMLAYRAGASVPEVQARLGHSTMRAASIYAHASDDSDRVLADRLDALFAPAPLERPLRAV